MSSPSRPSNDHDRRRPDQAGANGQRSNRRQRSKGRPKPQDVWRPVPQLDPPELIAAPSDPAALLRSLGDVPLQGQATTAAHFMAAVIERAAGLATALAAAGGLLAETTYN